MADVKQNMKPESDAAPQKQASSGPSLSTSLHGAQVERFNGLEPIQAIPREVAAQNWHVGKVSGKHSVDRLEVCCVPPCILVVSSLNGNPGHPKPADRVFHRVCVPLTNLKDFQLKE